MQRDFQARREALVTVRRFNAVLSAKGRTWFWPKIAAALVSKHHWLVIVCDSCDGVVDLELRVKPRDPGASIRIALRDVQCPRCNGHGRPRIIALAAHPSAFGGNADINSTVMSVGLLTYTLLFFSRNPMSIYQHIRF